MATLLSSEEDLLVNAGLNFKDSHEEDLILAAEIGKSLLERNRELEVVLKATQEFAEEQCAQVDFYVKQIEILRDGSETKTRTCEQLESNNQILTEKCEQWENEHKILEGKNSRLWEVINSLEKRVETLTSELDKVNEELTELKEESVKGNGCGSPDGGNDKSYVELVLTSNLSPCELENESFRKQISELNIQNNLAKIEKGEMESQLEDLLQENQALYHKISNLNQEISEWENFAQKEENYRRLAAAFTLKHYTEVEPETVDIVEKKIQETLIPKKTLTKARSCECIQSNNEKKSGVAKSPNLVNNILSSANSSSFLSELDTEYAELVKRYEALLEKLRNQEGTLKDNPERTRKVQRAIQTLSIDFSLRSPTKVNADTSPMKDSMMSFSGLKSPICDGDDYRQLFSDIFAKLKETGCSN